MRQLKIGLALSAIAFMASVAVAEGGEVMKSLKAGDWAIMLHLKAIPDEYREMAKATHHLSVMVMKPDHSHITDAKVSFKFSKGNKVVAEGETHFMGGMGHEGSGHKKKMESGSGSEHKMEGGHYGADLTLPGPGEYRLQIVVEHNNETRKVGTKITAP